MKFFSFLINSNLKSDFFEVHYVNSKKKNVHFSKKKNLIMIFVESLETSFFTKNQGGYWNYDVIPELNKLLTKKDSTVFYKKRIANEMKMLDSSSWTTASLVANTSGIPLKVLSKQNEYYSDNFLSGAYTLGDLLAENGYHNEMISSANTTFGGVNDYFTKHGDFDIIDIDSLSDYGFKLPKKYKNSWGFNDKYLFDIAKNRLKSLSVENKPFNMSLITIDTHFPDGFVYDFSTKKYKSQYENAYATTSKLISDFISWVKKQDFYDDTVIVIVGDHLSMQTSFFSNRGAKDRYIYCCYINSDSSSKNTSNRVYTSLDTFPTVVSSIGGKIDGDRLGLGVNLFSSQKTLVEKYGFKKLNKELAKKSNFYNRRILGDDYKKMAKKKE